MSDDKQKIINLESQVKELWDVINRDRADLKASFRKIADELKEQEDLIIRICNYLLDFLMQEIKELRTEGGFKPIDYSDPEKWVQKPEKPKLDS